MEVVRALAGDEVDVEPKKYKPDGQDREETGVPRPRKRRKVEHNEESEGEEDVLKLTATSAKLASPDLSQSPPATTRGTPTPPLPSTLPSFPLPSRPNAPARSELVSQGLDRALAHAQIVDPGLSVPLSLNDDEMSAVGLGSKMRSRLTELGISELFAVQTTLLPLLLPSERLKRALYLPYDPPRDICVSAPTGSGKTLAYVLPIVETLSFRIVTRLRALVVLPTRDLVTQVQETFETIGKGRGLKIGTVTGQHSFAHEQAQLIADKSTRLQGGSSKVDILICTPGRLMDHLTGTPGFSLQHLRFLVIDEADRLLAQSFQDWLAQVLAATRPPSTLDVIGEPEAEVTDADVPYPDALAPAFIHLLRSVPTIRTDLDEKRETSCQKLLFSATLMSDPGKIAALELRDPQYIVVQAPNRNTEEGMLGVAMEKFSMPATLKEHMVVCDASQKPLILFHLVLMHGVRNALVFTKSTESTQRLVRLFDFFEKARMAGTGAADTTPVVVRAYSSDLSPSERKSILEKFKTQKVDILICSDLISRGIDISHVAHVVSYDAPVDMRKYVHRVGRTARAGRTGDAWTLVEEQEARYFKNMLRTADHADVVSRVRISGKQLASLTAFYEAALRELKDVYTHDKNVGE
ncbi:DEAD-domain-containing protein [Artomyces pyxidatus]|uniref:DEAD-domain-containing protein n=1 Tax=Artomyces pyxidatus TaxID=48021 RepID=A0ACB8TFG3_9AGAM|nr:DEAD-domain-containing protein [Artomyces pyxidatus]